MWIGYGSPVVQHCTAEAHSSLSNFAQKPHFSRRQMSAKASTFPHGTDGVSDGIGETSVYVMPRRYFHPSADRLVAMELECRI